VGEERIEALKNGIHFDEEALDPEGSIRVD